MLFLNLIRFILPQFKKNYKYILEKYVLILKFPYFIKIYAFLEKIFVFFNYETEKIDLCKKNSNFKTYNLTRCAIKNNIKVLIQLFQKVAVSKGRAFGRWRSKSV